MNSIIFPLKPAIQGAKVADLQDALQIFLERRAILANDERARRELSDSLKRERPTQTFAEATSKLVSAFQKERRLEVNGEIDEPTANALNALLAEFGLLDQPTGPAAQAYQVDGKVFSRLSAGVGDLRVVIVDKQVGGDFQLAQATTDDLGAFKATFSDSEVLRRTKTLPDLQARVFTGDTFLGASDVRYNASQLETLNVLLEDKAASALRSEHEVLTSAIASQFTGKLGELKETDERQDITYLANKTGWDARAIAMAALADQFSARTADATGAPAIAPVFFYALFRAGLPTNEDTLYHVDTKILEGVWTNAAEQGVIPKASADQLRNLVERFQALSAQRLLTAPALIGSSSLKEMLAFSGLTDAQQATFAQLYTADHSDMQKFWTGVANSLGAEKAERLRLDGRLGFLTINNVPLMQKVHTAVSRTGLSDLLQLAQEGYHRSEPWMQLLTADVPIPNEIPGEAAESKRAYYADYLAAQVRLSYPTASVAQMVKSRDLPLTGAENGIADQVHAFLTEHQGKFEIGVQPVQQYIAKNNLQVADTVVQQVKRLQRVYQITPSDQAMVGLMKHGIDAAYHIVGFDKETFVQSFAADLGGPQDAALTYDRSVQIHNAVLNIALSYLNARTAPAIGVHSPGGIIDPAPAHTGDVIATATLESLFGSMDFCACEHCRSILSPAAYLVDLLLFLDQPKPPAGENPQTVLFERRPDINHLPLTCENTNTALPYIDVVNETLEYFIANTKQKLSLKDYPGHDTNGVVSEDLLASPQFVMDSAYTILRDERFPALLPFHQPLENLRRYFNKFEVPLPLAMERLRRSDDLERGANAYGWRDILMEELGLSRSEYDILTRSVPDENDELKNIFGFPSAESSPIDKLSNAKRFARRVGITYEDLVAILKTRFINPNSYLIPKLERLFVSFATLKALKEGTISDTEFKEKLAKLAVPPDPAAYGGDLTASKDDYAPIIAWVKDNANYNRIMGLITLAIPAGNWAAGKSYLLGDCVLPTVVQPGSTLYYECTTAGQSASSASFEPKWPTTPGDKFKKDGSVEWTCRDASSCLSFDNMAFRYSDPAKATQNIAAAEFILLLRFIRLWKKLNWTIEQTDAVICALYRADLKPFGASDISDVSKLNTGFLTLLPRLGIVRRVMKALNLTVKRDLLPLLACWSEIGTHGNTALYHQMFLNPSTLKQDAVFADNGYGEFLQDQSQTLFATNSTKRAKVAGKITPSDILSTSINGLVIPYKVTAGDTSVATLATNIVSTINATTTADPITGKPLNQVVVASNALGIITFTMKDSTADGSLTLAYSVSNGATETYAPLDHESALCAALNLTGTEFALIAEALKFDATTQLNLKNISSIFRQGWLARKLKLSVREFLLLTQLSGLDPFAAPDIATQPAPPAPPVPAEPPILRLIAFVQALRDRSLKSAAALYLIWNQDLSGKSAPDSAQVAAFARTLRLGLAEVETEFAVKDDPDGTLAQARMALVYGTDTTSFFFSLLNDSFVTEVEYSHAQVPLVTSVIYKRAPAILVTDVPYTHHQTSLEQPIQTAAPNLTYDDAKKRLSYTGALSTTTVDALKTAADSAITDNEARDLFKSALDTLILENQKVINANLEQAIVDVAPGLIYNNAKNQLSYTGALSTTIVAAVKAAADTAITDKEARGLFKSAVDSLYEENKKVIKSNLEQLIVDEALGRIAYDAFRKRLSYTGIPPESITEKLKNAAVKTLSSAAAVDNFNEAVKDLFEKIRKIVDPFFDRYSELRPLYEAYSFFLQLRSSVAPTQPQAALDESIIKAAPERLTYDGNLGQLSYVGVMSDSVFEALKNASGATEPFVQAVDKLHTENQNAINAFFIKYPTLGPSKPSYLLADNSPARQRTVLLEVITPELKRRRKEQHALQSVTAFANTELALTQTLLNARADPFPLHAAEHTEQPALNDILALEKLGLSVEFFANDTASGTVIPNVPGIATSLDYGPSDKSDGNSLPVNPQTPGAAISGVWHGYLEAPESGFFSLGIEADASAKVTLLLDDKPVKLPPHPTDATLHVNADPIELRAGTLYSIDLTVEKVSKVVRVQWEWQPKGEGRTIIPARYLYPAMPLQAFKDAYIRFLKAASLAAGLGLTANELAYFATHADYRINAEGLIDSSGQPWLNALPNVDNLHPETAVGKNLNASLLTPFSALLYLAQIKKEISPSDESLLTVLKDPAIATHKTDSTLFTITRWNRMSLNAVLAQFGSNIAALGHFELFRRVYDAFALIQKMGISAQVLIQGTTNEPTANTVRELQAALRARYDAASWRDVVRPINDEMRSLQRDAMVDYILHQMRSHPESAHIDTPDKLFEYFLMDVQMDPCMQTSRIRHALSSVQLFVERCLMNLETRVSRAAISTNQRKQWEWMKRYRVWEANRKVYLFPENWLEPELRDDQSPFFKETMSELLQSDITEDSAATALLNYLSKLEEVAKLEPCGIYHIPSDDSKPTPEINHVVARTVGAHRKYYYRRREGVSWTPWEQIKLDIEANPIIPVVWKDRLFLFWVRILKESPLKAQVPKPIGTDDTITSLKMSDIQKVAGPPTVTVKVVLCWSEYYNGKWQPTKTSDVNNPLSLGSSLPSWLISDEAQDGHLKISAYNPKNPPPFLLYNTHSLPEISDQNYSYHEPRTLETPPPRSEVITTDPISGTKKWTTYYFLTIKFNDGSTDGPEFTLFKTPTHLGNYGTVQPRHALKNIREAPFFYEDSYHVFFVTARADLVPLPNLSKYGRPYPATEQAAIIAPLLLQISPEAQFRPIPIGDGELIRAEAGAIDSPMKRFIAENAYIRQGIDMTGVVTYTGIKIGPAGAVTDLQAGS